MLQFSSCAYAQCAYNSIHRHDVDTAPRELGLEMKMSELQKLQAALNAANAAYEQKMDDCDESTDFAEELAAIRAAEQELEAFLSNA